MKRAAVMALVAVGLAGIGPVRAEGPKADLLTTIEELGDFKVLGQAIEAAGMAEELRGAGPFTLFAPNDAAFGKLPAGTVESLLEPANRGQLRALVTYHLVEGEIDAATLGGKVKTLTTVEGGELTIKDTGRIVRIDDGALIAPDLRATNGIVHVIDKVASPPGG